MSHLLAALARGLPGRLSDVFDGELPGDSSESPGALAARAEQSPKSLDLQVRLGAAHLRELHLSDARRAFDAALRLDRSCRPALIGLACVQDQLGVRGAAVDLLEAAQRSDPRNPAIAFAVGLCHENAGDAEAARRGYELAAELCPALRNAHERLAALAVLRGDWREACARYERMVELEPAGLPQRVTLATLLLQCGDYPRAIEEFERALLIEPDAASGAVDEVGEINDDDALSSAVQTLEGLVDKYPGVSEFRIHLADLYVKSGDDAGAVAQYSAALDIQPDFLEATVKLGTQHLRAGRFADAAQHFVRGVALNDRLLSMFVGLGVAQHAVGRHNESDASFDLAASLAPNSTLLFAETARLYLRTRRETRELATIEDDELRVDGGSTHEDLMLEAVRRHREALAENPLQADLHLRYGLLASQLGDAETATRSFHAAVALNPSYETALVHLGISLRQAGEPKMALEAFRRATAARSDDVGLHYQLALLYARRSEFEIALEEFDGLTQDEPGRPALRQNVALALQNIGVVDRAGATWRAVCDLCVDDPPQLRERFGRLHETEQD